MSRGLGGFGGCNWYGGRLALYGDTLLASEIARTARACSRPSGVLQQEDDYLALLKKGLLYRIAGDTLSLNDGSGEMLATFRRRIPLAMNAADLIGTSWMLESLKGKPLMSGTRIILTLYKDSIRGEAGCRGYTGLYSAEGDAIRFPAISMLTTECPDAPLLRQEEEFTTVLSETEHYRLEADRLELYAVNGDTLVFLEIRPVTPYSE